MESKLKSERKLAVCIDSLVDEMDGMYCANFTDGAKIDSKMGDIKFREELIKQIKEEIRCKKLSEQFMTEQGRKIRYSVNAGIDKEGIEFSIAHIKEDSCSTPT